MSSRGKLFHSKEPRFLVDKTTQKLTFKNINKSKGKTLTILQVKAKQLSEIVVLHFIGYWLLLDNFRHDWPNEKYLPSTKYSHTDLMAFVIVVEILISTFKSIHPSIAKTFYIYSFSNIQQFCNKLALVYIIAYLSSP